MGKMDALKEKWAGLRAAILGKADKIPWIRSYREKKAASVPEGREAGPGALRAIYRDGSTGTRIQVIAFYLFIAIALYSSGSLLKKVLVRMRSSSEHEKIAKDYSHELAELKRRAEEKAEMVALGQFTSNVFFGSPGEAKVMSIDLWVRVSDPKAAATVNSRLEAFRDRTMSVLNALSTDKVNLAREEGKAEARKRIRAALTSALEGGSVEDVFIHNLTVQ